MSARTCPVDGCDKAVRTKGYCDTHYRRWRKYGDPCAPDRSTRAHRKPPKLPVTVDVTARLEDCEWMVETGENLNGAAARIGISPDGLAKWLTDNGRPDLRATLVDRNPRALADPTLNERRVRAWHESRRRRKQAAA